MGRRWAAPLAAVIFALLAAPRSAYALFEPGAILTMLLLGLVLVVAWVGVSVPVEAFVYRRALAWPLKQASLHSLVANIAGFAGWRVLSSSLGAIRGSVGESLMFRSPLLSVVLGGFGMTLVMTAIEVGVLVALNRQFAPRRRLVAVGAGINVLTIGIPLILIASIVPAMGRLRGPSPRLSSEWERTLPIATRGGVGNKTTEPFKADESWYVEWMRGGGANTSQPLDITLMRDNVLFSHPVKELRTIHFVPGQGKSRTETVRETGWFRLKVKASGGWQVTVYRADRPPGRRSYLEVPRAIAGDRA